MIKSGGYVSAQKGIAENGSFTKVGPTRYYNSKGQEIPKPVA
jgi:hypothetical protein